MTYDVLIVGGGPAGAGTAYHLAMRGVRVLVLDRARFPRPKPCAECLSPQTSRLLHDMGLLEALERQGALLKGMEVHAPNGRRARGDYDADHGWQPFRTRGLAIRRELLDQALLRRAQEAGAAVELRARAVNVSRDALGSIRGVEVMRPGDGARVHRAARLVVGADGLRSVIARRLGLARSAVWPRRISLVAHYRGVSDVGEYGEMHVESDGFVGIADVGAGVTTVAAVFPTRRAADIAGDRTAFIDRWLASKPHLAHRFERAIHEGPVTAVGPFASHARRAWHDCGALLVGDAADFFDPFTGEGIYAALRGGELAAAAVSAALGAPSHRDRLAALCSYEQSRRREFSGKWRVERLIGAGVAWPALVNRAVRAMDGTKSIADLLVGVTGDFVPPQRVLNLGFLARLLLLPIPATAVTPNPAWR